MKHHYKNVFNISICAYKLKENKKGNRMTYYPAVPPWLIQVYFSFAYILVLFTSIIKEQVDSLFKEMCVFHAHQMSSHFPSVTIYYFKFS
jgi:hypothetical protein